MLTPPPVCELIAYNSQFMTLEPGDILATGTPAGIGAFRQPPQWLQAGDQARLEVSRVGMLENLIGRGILLLAASSAQSIVPVAVAPGCLRPLPTGRRTGR